VACRPASRHRLLQGRGMRVGHVRRRIIMSHEGRVDGSYARHNSGSLDGTEICPASHPGRRLPPWLASTSLAGLLIGGNAPAALAACTEVGTAFTNPAGPPIAGICVAGKTFTGQIRNEGTFGTLDPGGIKVTNSQIGNDTQPRLHREHRHSRWRLHHHEQRDPCVGEERH
jgi:hypothetical protein